MKWQRILLLQPADAPKYTPLPERNPFPDTTNCVNRLRIAQRREMRIHEKKRRGAKITKQRPAGMSCKAFVRPADLELWFRVQLPPVNC